jgi:hypothetical protein
MAKERREDKRRPFKAIRLPMHVHDVLEELARRGFRSIPQEAARLILAEGERQGIMPPSDGGPTGEPAGQQPAGKPKGGRSG